MLAAALPCICINVMWYTFGPNRRCGMKKVLLLMVVALNSMIAFGADEDAVWAKLKTITIPEVDLRSATLVDALNFIVDSSRTNDTSTGNGIKGVNLVINLAAGEKEKLVSLTGRNFQLLQLLNLVTKSAGVKYRVAGSVIMVGGSDGAGDKERISRAYGIPLTISSDVRKKGAKKFFEELGVKFPEGASATYSGATGKMLVVNSPENIRFMEKILTTLGVSVTQ